MPATLSQVKQLLAGVSQSQMRSETEGYLFYEQTLTYGDIEQRWLLVLYEKKRECELKQLDKAVAREREQAHKALK